MNTHMFPVGKTLYHGSINKLTTGYPNNPKGNWFSTDPKQSILHTVSAARTNKYTIPYLYIYKVIHSPRLIKFNTPANFNALARKMGLVLPKGRNTFAFSNENYKVAAQVCKEGVYDGWWFPADQSQVVLCEPMKFLKFVKVLEIKRPEKGFLMSQFRNGMWKSLNLNKISTSAVKLNNILNLKQPSNKYLYFTNSNGIYKFFNLNGNPVNVNIFKKTFNYKGQTYLTNAYMKGVENATLAKIMINRIKNKTGENIRRVSLGQLRLETKNNAERSRLTLEAHRRYLRRMRERPVVIKNVSLNASALYK
jgi:hypothetical protein